MGDQTRKLDLGNGHVSGYGTRDTRQLGARGKLGTGQAGYRASERACVRVCARAAERGGSGQEPNRKWAIAVGARPQPRATWRGGRHANPQLSPFLSPALGQLPLYLKGWRTRGRT